LQENESSRENKKKRPDASSPLGSGQRTFRDGFVGGEILDEPDHLETLSRLKL
jgi:hypothetical protein